MADPILRWAGSKKKLLPLLVAASPAKFDRYVEPFVGSAVLFLKLNASEALLGDINKDLIETYEIIRDHPRAVWNRISVMSLEPQFYYELRQIKSTVLKPMDRAARFVYLNRFCFNGVYRTNQAGQFNVARGSGHLYVPSLQNFIDFSQSLRKATLSCIDFESQVDRTRAGDFLYLDPPYALGNKRNRGEYGIGSFRDHDEARLIESIVKASGRGVNVLLSYSPSKFILNKLQGWKVHNLTVARNVAGFADSRRRAEEILVSNYEWNM